MGLIKFKDIKKSSVYITPNFPVIQTKRYKFDLKSILFIIFGYSFFVFVITVTILAFTPVKDFIFLLENKELTIQAKRISELEKEVMMLTRNLNGISAANKKLNFAMTLAGTDSLDTTAAVYDSLKSAKRNPPFGGNILLPVRKLIYDLFQTKKNTPFLIAPASGIIIKGFNVEKGHFGIDYAVQNGTPVYASAGGLVLFSGFKLEDGNTIMIQHGERIITIYKHCSLLLKQTRDIVSQGEVIAMSGNSGYNSTGDHLHFEVWYDGKAVDPKEFLIN